MVYRIKEIIFGIVAIVDLVIAYQFKNGKFFTRVILALLVIISLIWFGKYWNSAFPPGIRLDDFPTITKETPPSVLALAGWILLIIMTVLLVTKCIYITVRLTEV